MKKIVFAFLFGLLMPAMIVFAQDRGKFTHVIIYGPGLSSEVNTTNPALLDFFSFADFSKGSVDAPANPGDGFRVIRVYIINNKAVPYDMIHYYPDTGYVFYDGVSDGASDYDGRWYVANPGAAGAFRSVLNQDAKLTWIPLAVLAVILIIFFVAYQTKPKVKS